MKSNIVCKFPNITLTGKILFPDVLTEKDIRIKKLRNEKKC